MNLLQILALIFSLFALSRVILRARDSKIRPREFIFWILVWIVLLGVVFFPDLTTYIANFLEIDRGIDLIVYLSIAVLFYMLFRLYIKLEEREQQMTKVVREMALLKRKLK